MEPLDTKKMIVLVVRIVVNNKCLFLDRNLTSLFLFLSLLPKQRLKKKKFDIMKF